jgi:Ni/Fe-hydrogenase 1 B-type cytochrome subunit
MTGVAARPRPLRREGDYRWVALWGIPLRVMHWASALSIVVLAVTGLYIGKPYFINSGDTSSHFLMGWVRFIHFTAAAVLVMTAFVRAYWLFAGNQYERLRALFPFTRKDQKNLIKQAKAYATLRMEEAPVYLGHNPMQQMSYTGLYVVALFQVISGFALYGQANPSGIFFRTLNWVGPLFGGMQQLRFFHHIFTWAFAIYLPIHIYFAIRSDVLERNSAISSMFTGGKMVPNGHKFEDE